MIQKSSNQSVVEVFYQEPTSIHFIREISRKIKIAPTSVRNNIKILLKNGIIIQKKSKPFDGFMANRDNEDFIWYKRTYNLESLKDLTKEINQSLHPKSIILFGSYGKGEDIETSDIDIVIISKAKKDLNLELYEKKLKRKINIIIVEDIKLLERNIQIKVKNGIVLQGEI